MTTPPTPAEITARLTDDEARLQREIAQLRQALAEREYALAETRGAIKALALLLPEAPQP